MKRAIIAVILLLSSSVFAAQQPIEQLNWGAGTVKPSLMQSTINSRLDNTQDNFTELYDSKESKADISCFADSVSFNACFALDWPTSKSATSLQMTFVSDDSLETQTGSKTKVPTGVDFTTADIGCDVSDSITFTLRKSSTVNGTYSTVGTISVSAAAQNESIDISSWANLTAGDWVRIDLTTAGTTAKECTVVIGGTEL